MATTPTNLPVPSESPRDLKFNAGKIDEFVTSLALKYVDRFGGEHYTIEGLRQLAQQAIAAYGWVPMDSFQAGATLTLPNQVLRWKLPDGDGDYYRWSGTLPKSVPENSTPESTGGIGAGAWLSVGDSVLRSQLASSSEGSGASMVMTSSGITVQQALEAAATTESIRENIVYATADYGIPNDGSDVSNQVSTFINANKGKFIVFDSGTYMFAGVELTGSGWEGTVIYFKGKHLLSPNTDGSNNFGGSWNGIVIGKYVNEITLYYRGDGNRANQPDREHIFNVIISGGKNIKIPTAEIKEIRGDGIYVTRSDIDFVQPENILFGNVIGFNSTKDGRNLVSIVSCNGWRIEYIKSENIGGHVAGNDQPGGLDIEPNDDDSFFIENGYVSTLITINAGTAGAGFVGTGSGKIRIKNCVIENAYLKKAGTVRVMNCMGCSINFRVDSIGDRIGLICYRADRCKVIGSVDGASFAGQIGTGGSVIDSQINIICNNITNAGFIFSAIERCSVYVDIPYFNKAGGSSNYIGTWFRNPNGITSPIIRDNDFTIKCPSSSGAIRAIEYYTTDATPVSFEGVNTLTRSSSFTGYSNFSSVLGNAGDKLYKDVGISGITISKSMPNNGTFKIGDIVLNSNPSGLVYGWVRLISGSSHVLGSDWGVIKYQLS